MRSNRFAVAGLSLSLVIFGGVSAWSAQPKPFDPNGGGLVLRGPDGSELPAPLLGTTVEVRVTGIVARARVTQVFQNPSREWLTGVYLFPLPDGAAVDTLRLVVGERVLEGVVQEKEKARKTEEAATQAGCKASLLEQLRPGLFTTSVSNVGPGETVEVEIELQQVVPWEQGRFVLRFPMLEPPRYDPPVGRAASAEEPELPRPAVSAKPINPFAFHVDLAPGFPLARVESSSHQVAVEADRKRLRWAVDLAEGMAPANRDFVLEWAPAVGREPRAVYFVEEVDGERYSLLMMMPPDDGQALTDRLPRETVFVIDTSGSMEGTALQQAKEALLLGLGRLQPGDWFNVIRFSDKATPLFPGSVPATPASLEQARAFIGAIAIDGGTNMLPALELALQGGQRGLVQQVIFATDGQVSNEADILRALPELLGDHRLFTVAIGGAPNLAFLRRAAELGRGSLTQISSLLEVAKGMAELFARLEAPMLRDIEVRWSDPAAEAWPARVPDLYLGEPLVVTSRLGEAGPVAVSGQRSGSTWQDVLPAPAEVKGAGLDKLWAGRKIQGLMDSLQDGGDLGEVRHAVTELGLRHHLVTSYTSLVAVDVQPTAPAGMAASRRLVPLNAPQGSRDAVEDQITVTAESPLLDVRQISTGATVSQTELEKIPSSRDPWAVLQSTPGVLTDRVNVGGNESGQQSAVAVGASVYTVDGVVFTDMAALGAWPSYFDFDAFEEIEVDTGGADVTLETPGARLRVVRPRGTNEWRGSAQAVGSGGGLTGDGEGDRLESLAVGDLEGGGPLSRDRLWLWGELGRDEVHRIARGGQEEERVRASGSFRLDAQLGASTSATLAGSGGEADGSGVGAGPGRSPETALDQEGREARAGAEVTHVPTASFYLTGAWGGSGRRLRDVPRQDGDLRIDATGVARGSWFGSEEGQWTREARLSSTLFFSTGDVAHELALGTGWRGQDEGRTLAAPERVGIAGETLGLADDLALAEVWQGGDARARTEAFSLWTQDTVQIGLLTAALGARFDRQDLGIPGGPRPATVAPRLGLTWALGAERETLLRASLGRFASRLGSRAAWHANPAAPGVLRSLFTDRDGDLLPGAGEPAGLRFGEGIDPLRPDADPDTVDAGLRPEITDEALLGLEHALRPEFVVGLQATWRRTGHLLEERLLVRDSATGEVLVATAGDWVPAGRLTGVLPDGTPYDVPFWDLRPGLASTGGTLLVDGDRRQDDLGLSLTWHKRLSHRWMSRGHVSWHDGDRRLGSAFRRFDDPTNTAGGGDDEGRPMAEGTSGRPHEETLYLGSRWSIYASGLVQLPFGVNLSAALTGRQGSPLPWSRQVVRERAGIARVQLTGRPDAFRASDLFTADVRLEKEVVLGDAALALNLEVFNLLDEDVALRRELDLGLGRGGLVDRKLAPRTFRLGVSLHWR
jgi:Ca-activated chloride channel family protein